MAGARKTPASGPMPAGARRTLLRWTLWPSWVLLAALALLFAAGVEVPAWAEYLPFALSLVFLGLPHGAVDHLVAPRLLGRGATPGLLAAVGFLYLVLGGLYLALWFLVPAAAFALFIALTWFHWGQGDLWSLRFLVAPEDSGYPPGGLSGALTLLVRGGLPMLVPLLAFPEVYRGVAVSVTGLFASGGTDTLAWAFEPAVRLLAGIVFAALALAALTLNHRAGGVAWRVDASETALLTFYFALVPPILAVGLYFCLWHASRHVGRLALLDGKSVASLEAGRVAPAVVRFARDAAPLTVAALILLLGLYLATPGAGGSPSALLALYLVLVSALTLPHVVVVSWMDYRQGLWRRSPERA